MTIENTLEKLTLAIDNLTAEINTGLARAEKLENVNSKPKPENVNSKPEKRRIRKENPEPENVKSKPKPENVNSKPEKRRIRKENPEPENVNSKPKSETLIYKPSLDTLRDALLSAQEKGVDVKNFLKEKFQAGKLSDLADEEYATVIEAVKNEK